MSEPGAANAERWSAPSIDGGDGNGLMTAKKLEELQKAAWDEAYEAGLVAGREAGAAEVATAAGELRQLMDALARPLDDTDDAVIEQLVELAGCVVRQLFQREITIDSGHVVGVVREAIQLLPVAARDVTVQLNPADAGLVRDSLAPSGAEPAWTIVEDPRISRGGCRVVTPVSRIDATAEARLNAALSGLLGDRRQGEE